MIDFSSFISSEIHVSIINTIVSEPSFTLLNSRKHTIDSKTRRQKPFYDAPRLLSSPPSPDQQPGLATTTGDTSPNTSYKDGHNHLSIRYEQDRYHIYKFIRLQRGILKQTTSKITGLRILRSLCRLR
jgi:hypothetical protein